jgi:uncharacterized membrane protein YczE
VTPIVGGDCVVVNGRVTDTWKVRFTHVDDPQQLFRSSDIRTFRRLSPVHRAAQRRVADTVAAVSRSPAVAPPRPRAALSTRAAVYLVAISSIGMGVALMVRAELGVAPNDVLNTGLSDHIGFGVGTAAWLTGSVAMVLAWLLGRRPRIATVVGSVIVGLSINASLGALPSPDQLGWRVAFLALGLAVVWSGITGVVAADVGAGPLELVMLAFMDRGVSITLLAMGLALGGSAGVGTAVFALGTGPVLAQTLPVATRRMGTQLTQPVDAASAGL